MTNIIDNKYFAFYSSFFGLILGILGLIQSNNILAIVGSIIFTLAIFFIILYFIEKRKFKYLNMEIENRRIESLNFANLRRLTNKSLLIKKAYHKYVIKNSDLKITFLYDGQCLTGSETGIVFSIDSDIFIPYDILDIIGYDLINDSKKQNPIKPKLLGKDGNSKKVKLFFFEPLFKNKEFSILLKINLHGCMNFGHDYITATLSFHNNPISELKTKICFIDKLPKQIDVYKVKDTKPVRVKSLKYEEKEKNKICFIDKYNNVDAQQTIVYSFNR